MFNFLRIQYKAGKIGVAQLEIAVQKGWITEEQKEQIVAEGQAE